MVGFLNYLLPDNFGNNDDPNGYARTQGLINASATIANMSAPTVGGVKASPLQLITNGLAAYQGAHQAGLNDFYRNKVDESKASNAEVQKAADKANLDWFNSQPQQPVFPTTQIPPGQAPTLNNFYNTDLTSRMIKAESGGNPNAVSPKGARGLMQIMPETAKDPGFGITPMQNQSPAENVRVGEQYIQALTQKYNGDQKLGLMAYNWGTGNVDKWLKEGARPEAVPEETRNYVTQILGQQTGAPPAADSLEKRAFAQHLYQLAEMQVRSNRPGAEALLRVAGMYDPNLAVINSQDAPAAIQIANEMRAARAAGDTQRLRDLEAVTKVYDKGILTGAGGSPAAIDGYGNAKKELSYADTAGKKEAESDVNRVTKLSEVIAKLPLLESDLNLYQTKLASVPPELMGPMVGTPAYYASPQIQDLTSTTRSIALQLKDIYNLGSGQGFTDTDRDYLDSIIGGAKVDPVAAHSIIKDMFQRVAVQKDVYKQTVDHYKKNNSLSGFIPTATPQGGGNAFDKATPTGVKYRVVQ